MDKLTVTTCEERKMEEVTIKVVCQVDSDGTLNRAQALLAAQQAIENAVRSTEKAGFTHCHADVASIGIVEVGVGDY